MEDDLADTPAYRPGVRWKVVDPVRQELHDDEVVAEAAMNHRPQRGIAAVAAIPIMLTIDLHRSEELRKRRRREQSIDRHIAVRDDPRQPRLDVGNGDEQCGRRLAA